MSESQSPAARRSRRRRALTAGALLAGTVIASVVAAPAADATVPKPLPEEVVGAASVGGTAPRIDLFYARGTNGSLVAKVEGSTSNLGGVLTSGVSALATLSDGVVGESVYGRGTDGAIWHRDRSGGGWLAWQSLGGLSFSAPGVTCVGTSPQPIVYVVGQDFALWRRTPAGWSSQGGDLWSDPVGVAPAGGVCPAREEAFALGGDFAVWQWQSTGWRRVGGRSGWAPAVTLLPDGGADLFVVGTDDAIWVSHREPAATAFGPFHRVGGIFTSSPSAAVDVGATASRNVYGLGTDGNVWRLSDTLDGVENWTVAQVP